MINIKSGKDIERMKIPNGIVRDFLVEVESVLKPGMSTHEVDVFAREFITKNGARPSFLNYGGFPGSICISIDDEVVHGIPSKKRFIEEGQIVSVDVGAFKNGFHGDACRSFLIGECSEEKRLLVERTKESFFVGLKAISEGARLGDISSAIQQFAEGFGYGVVRELCGHGIGRNLHEDPEVPNYGKAGTGVLLKDGMALAIEPMINLGVREVEFLSDGWTCKTLDRKPSAHYENTIVIVEGEPLILTL